MPIEILMPALSPTMTEGNLAKWVKKEGDKVKPGEVIAEIETDKATMEVESVDDGVIGKILIKEGSQNVSVNSVIALLLEEGEDKSAIANYKIKSKKEETKQEEKEEKVQKEEKTEKVDYSKVPSYMTPPPLPPVIDKGAEKIIPGVATQGIKISPVAKKIADEYGINISKIIGSGPHGRIVKEDIEEAVKFGGVKPPVKREFPEHSLIDNNQMRKVIAMRLLQSKQHVPHFYLTIDCDIDKLLNVRYELNNIAKIDENNNPVYKVSVNDMMIKAVALALKDVPDANASWSEESIIRYNNVDVSVAVAIDGGLITPIIRNADQKSIQAISHEMKDLAKRARDGKLAPEEFQGGGFSISNLGMYGIKEFKAIINPPQSCIMAIGAGDRRPVVQGNNIIIANMVTISLSCDHRVVDGAVGAEFLKKFKFYIENPISLIV